MTLHIVFTISLFLQILNHKYFPTSLVFQDIDIFRVQNNFAFFFQNVPYCNLSDCSFVITFEFTMRGKKITCDNLLRESHSRWHQLVSSLGLMFEHNIIKSLSSRFVHSKYSAYQEAEAMGAASEVSIRGSDQWIEYIMFLVFSLRKRRNQNMFYQCLNVFDLMFSRVTIATVLQIIIITPSLMRKLRNKRSSEISSSKSE